MSNEFDLTKPWFAIPAEFVVPPEETRSECRDGLSVVDEYRSVSPAPPVSVRKVVLYTFSVPLVGLLLSGSFVTLLVEIMNDSVNTYLGKATVLYAFGVAYAFMVFRLWKYEFVWRIYHLSDIHGALYDVTRSQFTRRKAWLLWGVILVSSLLALVSVLQAVWWLLLLRSPYGPWELVRLKWIALVVLLGTFALLCIVSVECLKVIWQARRFTGEPVTTRLSLGTSKAHVAEGSAGVITLVHWSDLHLTASDKTPTVEGGDGGNPVFRSMLQEFATEVAAADVFLISGDITDGGTPDEWKIFFEELDKYPGLKEKAVMIPGNHDVNITDPRRKGLVEGRDSDARKIRLVRTIAALNRIQGERAVIDFQEPTEKTLKAWFQELQPQLEEFVFGKENGQGQRIRPCRRLHHRYVVGGTRGAIGPVRMDEDDEVEKLLSLPDDAWEKMFPMVLHFEKPRFALILLNSNYPATNIMSNALGHFSERSLQRLAQVRETLQDVPCLYVIHHHIALPRLRPPHWTHWFSPKWWRDLLFARMMCVVNGHEFLSALGTSPATVILHGHRHITYHGLISGVHQVVSASSTTLKSQKVDDENRIKEVQPGFYVYRIGLLNNGDATVLASTWRG